MPGSALFIHGTGSLLFLNLRNGAIARAKKASNDDAYHQFSIT
jgi:hypothetical protein